VQRVPKAILRVLANINASVDLDTGQVVEHVTPGPRPATASQWEAVNTQHTANQSTAPLRPEW
jgi:hypothetical protein